MATFTDNGVSASVFIKVGQAIAASVSGTFAAKVSLERDLGGGNYLPIVNPLVGYHYVIEPGTYRLRCYSYASGIVTYTLALEDVVENQYRGLAETYATLPLASSVAAGTTAYTTDVGQVVSDGMNWITEQTPSLLSRAVLIGDSHLANGLGSNVAVTSFTVSAGVATIASAGNNSVWAGNYFMLANLSDATLVHPDNGSNPIALTGAGGNSFTFATTAADGTYTNYASGSWTIQPIATASDSSWFNFYNAFLGGQYIVTHSFATVGATSAFSVAELPNILAKAANYEAAVVSQGTNDIQAATSIDTADTLAATALANIKTICNSMLAVGKSIFLTIPPPVGSATGYTTAKLKYVNFGLFQLRQGLLEYALRRSDITVADVWAATINGTTANGEFVTNYTSDGVHVTTQGLVPFARAMALQTRGSKLINRACSFYDDDYYGSGYTFVTAPTYPNRTRNSVFAGTGGNVTGTNVTGSNMPGVTNGNWRFTNSGANPTIEYSKVTPTVPTGYFPNWANQRSAARMNITTATTNDGGRITQHDFNNTTTWAAGWYRISYQLYIRATPTNLRAGTLSWNIGNILYAMSAGASNPAGATGGWPLLIGDLISIVSGPIYLSSAPTNNILTIDVTGQGAGYLLDCEVMSPEVRQIANPYEAL